MKNRTLGTLNVLTKGVGEDLDDRIQREIANASDPITALFINWPRLTTAQLSSLIRRWKMPVYDRLTLVTTLFRLNCTSPESKLQARIAELTVLKTRLPAVLYQNTAYTGQLSKVYDAIDNEETRMQKQLRELELEQKKNKINLRRRSMEQSPTISVLGYTNAGKTSLIKHVSRKANLVPKDQVFATLNISAHQAFININRGTDSVPGPGLRTRFIDTIGFMSDLPVEFLAAFRATIRECFFSDLIINVVDVSENDWRLKANFVDSMIRKTFNESRQHYSSDDQLPQLLTVGTKIDLKSHQGLEEPGEGMENLHNVILNSVAKRKNWSRTEIVFDQSDNDKLEQVSYF
ncbi:putative GTP-binding protein 6 [Cichlidogyrus casuarinus]|uniref:GTP-binding protein 6 n=1 Tax=Cichlidogyrus casuarinus TaxID=1844966 RepID=A0ABD2QGI6_9PLAT